ncbi:putative signal transduction histidine kinase [Mycobacterium xenopi 4042]|uniref:Putative signal transduction histidine kinase n=1 Tax=Mycobacterium xenopi 4042 TaxID=1299334 RepID=X7YK47_MYCXE|nr:putative signal transduction histidine kinase [Mycobacterium xenopi 4042]
MYTTEEIGQVAHAVDELHTQALLLAGDEARLRLLVNDMFETMSRRNRSLVDQQLALIDRLERNEEDPDRLDSLFRLDHLAARMRRNGANLLVLAGAQITREQRDRCRCRQWSTRQSPRWRTTDEWRRRWCPTAPSRAPRRATSCTCLPN